MVEHTPGPWSIHPRRAVVVPLDHVLRPVGAAEDPAVDLATYAQEICLMHWPDPHRTEAEVEANARLIAGAPDLLGQLVSAQVDLDLLRRAIEEGDPKAELLIRVTDLWKRNAAALAKATPVTGGDNG